MLSTNIKSLKLNTCLFNASGPHCTTIKDLTNLDNSNSACILSKSCTLYERGGNPEPRYYDNILGSINSMGLPNLSISYYIGCCNYFKNKPYIISIGVLDMEDTITIIQKIFISIKYGANINGIEINLSCPNIVGKGQIAYNMIDLDKHLEKIFTTIKQYVPYNIIVGIKLPPYFELYQFSEVCDILCKYDIDFITSINSIGNGLIIDYKTETTLIKPKNGIGGIGGKYIKPTGLSNVRNFYIELKKRNSNINIIGCGGIECGIDAFEYILCGADALQIGTQFYKEGVSCFDRISDELIDIMKQKNYSSLEDFKGKLNTI